MTEEDSGVFLSIMCYLIIRVGGHFEGEEGSRGETDSQGHGDLEGVDGH